LSLTGSGTLSYKKYDSEGNFIGSDDVTYFPGAGVISKDHSSEVAFKTMQEETAKEPKIPDVPNTIYLEPYQTAENIYGKWTAGAEGKVVGFTAPEGVSVSTKFTAPGMKENVVTSYVQAEVPNQIASMLEGAFTKTEVPNYGILALDLTKDQTIIIDGKPLDPKYKTIGVIVTGGYHSVVVQQANKEDVLKNVYVGAGDSVNIAAVNPEIYENSGGGGGGGGGATGTKTTTITNIYNKATSGDGTLVTYAGIEYGPACELATIYQDDAQIWPQIGKQYQIKTGIHSIRILKEGFKEWTKQISLFEGDSMVINPVFEEEDGPEEVVTPAEETVRVYINSAGFDGAKIIINGGFTGQWTPGYLDLVPNLYKLKLTKSGYKDLETWLYVKDVVAYGDTAYDLGGAEGWVEQWL
jgi:hypothetical protein